VVAGHGMNAVVFWPPEDRDRQLSRFSEELVPLLRDALTTA
jgi:hypothetical protein